MTPVLIDSCSLIWLMEESDRLSDEAHELVGQDDTRGYVSTATYTELAIKVGDGDYDLKMGFLEFFEEATNRLRLTLLDVRPQHADVLRALPKHRKRKHANPFDRLMIAQAIAENMAFITADGCMDLYGFDEIMTHVWKPSPP